MKEKPILFSGPMVTAILEGRKTQTRRVIKPQPHKEHGTCGGEPDTAWFWRGEQDRFPTEKHAPYPVGTPLWVRETHAPSFKAPKIQVAYRADGRCYGIGGDGAGGWSGVFHGWLQDSTYRGDRDGATLGRSLYQPWKPSIFMPRWASRIQLMVEAVRVERVQSISPQDCKDEGVSVPRCGCEVCAMNPGAICTADASVYLEAYRDLWISINGQASWDANPWVWVYNFKRI